MITDNAVGAGTTEARPSPSAPAPDPRSSASNLSPMADPYKESKRRGEDKSNKKKLGRR